MIERDTAFQAWVDALKYVVENGEPYKDSRGRVCVEVENLKVVVKDSQSQLTLPIEHLQSIQEWVYPSILEIAEITLAKNKGYIYDYAYGTRLFEYQGSINQISDYVIPLLKRDPTSRRAIVTLYDPQKDADPNVNNVPGLVVIDFKLRDGKLNIVAFIRSSDVFIGWPANVYQLFVLQEYVAARIDVEPGSITTFSTSAHVFEDHTKLIDQLIK
jgi:thymidylate synthase